METRRGPLLRRRNIQFTAMICIHSFWIELLKTVPSCCNVTALLDMKNKGWYKLWTIQETLLLEFPKGMRNDLAKFDWDRKSSLRNQLAERMNSSFFIPIKQVNNIVSYPLPPASHINSNIEEYPYIFLNVQYWRHSTSHERSIEDVSNCQSWNVHRRGWMCGVSATSFLPVHFHSDWISETSSLRLDANVEPLLSSGLCEEMTTDTQLPKSGDRVVVVTTSLFRYEGLFDKVNKSRNSVTLSQGWLITFIQKLFVIQWIIDLCMYKMEGGRGRHVFPWFILTLTNRNEEKLWCHFCVHDI